MNKQIKLISCFFIAVGVFSAVTASPIETGVEDVGRDVITGDEDDTLKATVNIYADKLIGNLDKLLLKAGLDPMSVPDIELVISRKFIITYWGKLRLSKIIVRDFSSIHRYGDAVISYDEDTKKMRIDIPLELTDIKFTCDYWAAIMGLGPWGGLDGRMNYVQMITSMEIDFGTFKANVLNYEITHTDHITINFREFILIDWFIDILSNSVTTVFKGLIVDIVNKVIGGALQAIVNIVNVVFEDIEKILDGNSTQLVTSPVLETFGIFLQETKINAS